LNQFEEFEHEKQIEKVVHEVCDLINDLMCLDELFNDDLVKHTLFGAR